MNLYLHRFRTVVFSRGKDFMPVGQWGSDMPAKMAENLQIDLLATFETYVIPVSEGSLARETKQKIVPNIEGNIVP